MASPARIKLVDPKKIWLAFNIFAVVIVIAALGALEWVQDDEAQKLVDVQAALLIKARVDDLRSGNYRNFIEGAGAGFQGLYVKIDSGTSRAFEFGTRPLFSKCHAETLQSMGAGENGTLTVQICRASSRGLLPLSLLLLVFIVCSIVAFLFVRGVERKSVSVLADFVEGLGVKLNRRDSIWGVLSRIKDVKAELETARASELELARSKALAEKAAQVAHDILPAISFLSEATADPQKMDISERLAMKRAVERTRDIALGLLAENRKIQRSEVGSGCGEQASKPELLISAVNTIVSEKRRQYYKNENLQISIDSVCDGYGLFANIVRNEFERVLSNILENAIDSLDGGAGAISVEMRAEGEYAVVLVKDNGQGIPEDRLPYIFGKGATFGKDNGSGLGLYHAKTSVHSWGGKIGIDSTKDKGTTVTVKLPRVRSPSWFVEQLVVTEGATVVILDDDPLVHREWKRRFADCERQDAKFALKCFGTAEDLQSFLKDYDAEKCIFLVDFELSSQADAKTGLDVIFEEGILKRSALVTNLAWNQDLQSRCENIGLKMLPKTMATMVPIIMENPSLRFPDAVIIDDDPMVHQTWKMSARKKSLEVVGCKNMDELRVLLSNGVSIRTPIFVDADLGGGIDGLEVARNLYDEHGFRFVFLATGSMRSDAHNAYWIRDVVGKQPTWSDPRSCVSSTSNQ